MPLDDGAEPAGVIGRGSPGGAIWAARSGRVLGGGEDSFAVLSLGAWRGVREPVISNGGSEEVLRRFFGGGALFVVAAVVVAAKEKRRRGDAWDGWGSWSSEIRAASVASKLSTAEGQGVSWTEQGRNAFRAASARAARPSAAVSAMDCSSVGVLSGGGTVSVLISTLSVVAVPVYDAMTVASGRGTALEEVGYRGAPDGGVPISATAKVAARRRELLCYRLKQHPRIRPQYFGGL